MIRALDLILVVAFLAVLSIAASVSRDVFNILVWLVALSVGAAVVWLVWLQRQPPQSSEE